MQVNNPGDIGWPDEDIKNRLPNYYVCILKINPLAKNVQND
jgi:hypothetical protein